MTAHGPIPVLIPYGNRSGDSGVRAYALLADGIVVQFHAGALYFYGPGRPGAATVKQLKALAQQGRGLSTYISQHVAGNFEAKFADNAWIGLP